MQKEVQIQNTRMILDVGKDKSKSKKEKINLLIGNEMMHHNQIPMGIDKVVEWLMLQFILFDNKSN